MRLREPAAAHHGQLRLRTGRGLPPRHVRGQGPGGKLEVVPGALGRSAEEPPESADRPPDQHRCSRISRPPGDPRERKEKEELRPAPPARPAWTEPKPAARRCPPSHPHAFAPVGLPVLRPGGAVAAPS